jgi:two-component system invasion response regulator UvrY
MVSAAGNQHSLLVAARVLIVDDSERFRAVAAELVAVQGLEVFGLAADAEQASALTSSESPDGVLLDIHLCDADGFTVAAMLARRCPTARIVLTSANFDRLSVDLVRACGATAYVSKDELFTADLSALFTPAGI